MAELYTLNARDNSLIHWLYSGYADADPHAFREAVEGEVENLRGLLKSRSVKYEDLKSALVPSRDGRQIVLLYNWLDDPAWNYAVAFGRLYLPLLRKTLRASMLHGDLHDMGGRIPVEALEREIQRSRSHSINWLTQYAVYFSNLRDEDVALLHTSLKAEPEYSGYLDVSRAGPVRDFVNRTVAHEWVRAGEKILLDHGPDEPRVSDQDPVGFVLAAYGYEVVSLIDFYFTGFLSYKIEAADAFQAADDRALTLAAATGALIDVESISVVVPPAKLEKYLLRDENKLRLMTSIGLQHVCADELSQIIRTKLLQSYLYDFRYAPDGTPLFAVSAEFEMPTGGIARRLLALKFDATRNAVSLVSMY